jgi:hypothetical protein
MNTKEQLIERARKCEAMYCRELTAPVGKDGGYLLDWLYRMYWVASMKALEAMEADKCKP